jgi:hypothetical protein
VLTKHETCLCDAAIGVEVIVGCVTMANYLLLVLATVEKTTRVVRIATARQPLLAALA